MENPSADTKATSAAASPIILRASTLRLVCLVLAILGAVAPYARGADAPAAAAGDDTFAVGYEFYGRAPYPVASRGLRLGYFLGDDAIAQLTYVSSQKTVLMTDFRYQEYGLRYISGFSSVLKFGLGLGLREVDLKYDVFVAEDTEAQSIHQRGQAVTGLGFFGLEIKLWDWLVVGSELFGVSVPLQWTRRSEAFPDSALEFEENPEEFPYISGGFGTNYQIMRSYVEVRF